MRKNGNVLLWRQVGRTAVTLFTGYNAILLMVVGVLMAAGDSLSGSHVWRMPGGILLIVLGLLFCVGGFGFCAGRVWARKVLFPEATRSDDSAYSVAPP